jgi:hypothetical protein
MSRTQAFHANHLGIDITAPPKNSRQKFKGVILDEAKISAASNECFTNNKKTVEKKKWIAEHDLYVTSFGRVMAKYEDIYMDAVTGSFYNSDGRCRSSFTLELGEVWKDQAGAAEQLMKLNADRGGIE